MKSIIVLALLTLSTIALSNEVVLIPGSNAKCNTTYDVFRSLSQNVYTLKNSSVKDLGDNVELNITVKLLKCVKQADGTFKFVVNNNHMRTEYVYPRTADQSVTVTKIDKEKKILAMSKDIEIIAEVELDKVLGEQEISLLIAKDKLDVNLFPAATQRGKYYTTLMLRSISEFKTDDYEFGSQYLASGKFRVFFNL